MQPQQQPQYTSDSAALDLNIDNYTLTDILTLFKIPIAFNEHHLKSAKKQVLKMHPDKSNLPKEYFLFFTKAYRILHQIYSMRHEHGQGYSHANTYSELISGDEMATCSADKLGSEHGATASTAKQAEVYRTALAQMSHQEFNTWFNAAFTKYRVPEDPESAGYEDWFRGRADDDDANANTNEVVDDDDGQDRSAAAGGAWNAAQVRKLERHRNRIRDSLALVASETAEPEMYGSGGNNLQYEDLKRAHTETLIPVTEQDYKNVRQFKTVLELQMFRSSSLEANSTQPLSRAESDARLEKIRIADIEQCTHRAYIMAKQDEAARDMNRKFMREFLMLTRGEGHQ
jgi:hypothetical protein